MDGREVCYLVEILGQSQPKISYHLAYPRRAGVVANKQIADELSITEESVKSRVKSILSKLGVNDRTQAAMIGFKRGIIDL